MSDFLNLRDDRSARRVVYVSAFLLIMVPFLQAGAQLWPLQLGNVQWRYSAANALSSVLLLPYLGLVLLILLSRAIESRNLAKAVGAGSVVVVKSEDWGRGAEWQRAKRRLNRVKVCIF